MKNDDEVIVKPFKVERGFVGEGSGYYWLHTHDATGIIHVESPTVRPYTLGEFFDVWGVRFTQTCLGGYCNAGGQTLRVYANGHLVTGNLRQLELTAHEEIVVTFGTEAQLPHPIPSSYGFPFGL